ncbi:chemotaxis protein CheD [Sphingomonas cavernae]|uniref:Probable chemoreceptor glutamine deamidase CheD n=1 Tax=Sphingomonas cavernae TaxID=2320861 RepID=A0A418W6Q1_9SPHN|nr:chemotaxis protein CheD [Sphingomonas cavernae]RJF85721.1 chemotaxis protein CheD [Sphingomonas cavernae]
MRRIPIVQGEHSVVAEPDVVISTLLGSCVAVCLQDPVARVGGMNHFLLGEPGADSTVGAADMQRYGVHAMELLINGMMKHGAIRTRLRAHLYGGANIIAGLGAIGSSNAAFARQFMETEGIAIGRCELGGTHARKVEFMPYEGRVRATTVANAPPPVIKPKPVAEPAGDVELF